MTPPINWSLIGRATEFYKDRGYQYLEVPWYVPHRISSITCPPGRDYKISLESAWNNVSLVGSAEQSFMYLRNSDLIMGTPHFLEPGKYVAVTPCFRRETEIDEYHQYHFMKVELYGFGSNSFYDIFIADALEFFNSELPGCEVVETDDGYDIVFDGIELGSYGRREHPDCGEWIYGTGLAEPRFSTVRNKHEKKSKQA